MQAAYEFLSRRGMVVSVLCEGGVGGWGGGGEGGCASST